MEPGDRLANATSQRQTLGQAGPHVARQSYPVATFSPGVNNKINQMATNDWWLLQDSFKSLTTLNFWVTSGNYHRQDDYVTLRDKLSCPVLTTVSRHSMSCAHVTQVSAAILIQCVTLPFMSLPNVSPVRILLLDSWSIWIITEGFISRSLYHPSKKIPF